MTAENTNRQMGGVETQGLDQILDPLDPYQGDPTEGTASDGEQNPWFNTANPKQKDQNH